MIPLTVSYGAPPLACSIWKHGGSMLICFGSWWLVVVALLHCVLSFNLDGGSKITYIISGFSSPEVTSTTHHSPQIGSVLFLSLNKRNYLQYIHYVSSTAPLYLMYCHHWVVLLAMLFAYYSNIKRGIGIYRTWFIYGIVLGIIHLCFAVECHGVGKGYHGYYMVNIVSLQYSLALYDGIFGSGYSKEAHTKHIRSTYEAQKHIRSTEAHAEAHTEAHICSPSLSILPIDIIKVIW